MVKYYSFGQKGWIHPPVFCDVTTGDIEWDMKSHDKKLPFDARLVRRMALEGRCLLNGDLFGNHGTKKVWQADRCLGRKHDLNLCIYYLHIHVCVFLLIYDMCINRRCYMLNQRTYHVVCMF